MKLRICAKFTAFFALLFASNAVATTDVLLKQESQYIYHVIKNKTLLNVTNQLTSLSGVVFKVSAEVEGDVINQKLVADDWVTAIGHLLQDYNFTIETKNNTVKTVLVSGRHGSGNRVKKRPEKEGERVLVASDFVGEIPEKYQRLNTGSVFNVTLPIEELNDIAVGDSFVLDLPFGQYTVKHDNQIEHADGSSTWVGYLDDEGQGYRVYLSQGEAGVIGNIYTPDGAYNIDTVDGQTVIIDIDKSGLDFARYDYDEMEATSAPWR